MLVRRQFIQTLASLLASAAGLVTNLWAKQDYSNLVNVLESAAGIEIENGLLKAKLRTLEQGIQQNYYAKNSGGKWELMAQSLQPLHPYPENTAPLYSDREVVREHRLLAASAFKTARISSKSPERVEVVLDGTLHGNRIQQRVSLGLKHPFFHIEVAGVLAGDPPRLEYLLSLFGFPDGASPDFTHVPCLKRAPDDVIADRIFNAPATIIQKQQRLVALIPDLNLLNWEVVYAKGARSVQGERGFRIAQDPEKISMPAIMDLNLKSGFSLDPVFAFGFADYVTEQHVFWRHENKDGAMVRQLSKRELHYGFDLFLNADAPLNRGFQRVSQHLWKRYGARYFRQPRPQVMPMAEYAKVCYPAAFAYQGDSKQDTKRYSEKLPYDPTASGPLPTWLEFDRDGKRLGGIRSTATQWYYDIQFSPWWNNVHDAEGMYWWGKQADPTLVDKARRIVSLALTAPQKEGIFPSVYRYVKKEWVGCYWKFPETFNPNWTFPDKWEPKALPHFWDMSSDYYQTTAASKTGVHLLRYRRRCEDNPDILPYLRRYGDFLIAHIDPNGCLPAWFTHDLQPVRELRFNAEGGIHIWFLSELYGATKDRRYLEAAKRMARFLTGEILPRQRWYDFETFYSCSIKPENFYDAYTSQWPQCTLSMLWAMDGFTALYKATGNRSYLSAGEAVADYSGFFQAVWQPHFVITAYAYGGLRSQNSDAEWLDMRQTCFAAAFMRLAELTHRQDFYERAVAAMRASFAIINHPRLIKNDVYRYPRYPLGIEPENIDHEGLPQDPLRSGFDWGEGGGLTAAAELLSELGGVYIDFQRRIAVGVDGVLVRAFRLEGRWILIDLQNQLSALPFPYENPYAIDLRLTGFLPGQYELIFNGGKPNVIRLKPPVRLRLEIGPSSVRLLSKAQNSQAEDQGHLPQR